MLRIFNKKVAPVMDLEFDMRLGPHSPEILKKKFKLLAELGFKRVYYITPPLSGPLNSFTKKDLNPLRNPGHWGLKSTLEIQDINFTTIFEAHKNNIEIFAVFKPYEGGGLHSEPHNKQLPVPMNSIDDIGGIWHGFESFIFRNQHLRVKRKPLSNYEDLIKLPINKIELIFCIDEVKEQIGSKKYKVFPKGSSKLIDLQKLKLWHSKDNGTYEEYKKQFSITQTIEDRTIMDCNEQKLFTEPRKCRIIQLTNIELPVNTNYLGITFESEPGQFVTIPYSMIHIYSGKNKIPCTCTPYARTENSTRKVGFQNTGFEFEKIDSIYWGHGWNDSACIGIAKGKMKYLKGTLCEAYPEVQEHWLEQIEKLLTMGVDGIDIRFQNHSSGVTDYMNYGFNKPILDAYQTTYGIDITSTVPDPIKLMQTRGQFFLEFLRSAKSLIHANGKKLQIHLRDNFENPSLGHSYDDLGFFALPKILPNWHECIDIADEITIKDYNWGTYKSSICKKIKDLAFQKNKPIWIHCYLQQGWDLNDNFLSSVNNDERITGLLLYEVVHSNTGIGGTEKGIIGVTNNGEVYMNNPQILCKLGCKKTKSNTEKK